MPQFDVDGAVSLADGSGAGPFQGNAVAADNFEGLIGEGVAELFGGMESGGGAHPVDLDADGVDHAARDRRHFRPDPVAFNQHDLHEASSVLLLYDCGRRLAA